MDVRLIVAAAQLFTLFGCLECITVSIRTNPPSAPYPAATWIQLACDVENVVGAVQYNWTVHCSRNNPSTSLGGLYGRTDHGQFSASLRSTPLSCADTIICSAADSSGVATATWRNEMVVGAGFWGNRQPLLNNSALKADAMGRINAIHCHSSSFNADVGRWISPAGVDFTENRMDNFTVRFNNGPYYPSYSSLELLIPSTSSFSPADQGVYSCMVPDNNGVMQVLHIGIYPHGYQGVFNITSVRRVLPENVIAINCSTTGVPPTLSLWFRSGNAVTSNETYQISQVLTNRRTSDYYSVLTINQTLEEGQGLYECRMINGLYEPMDNNFTEVAVERHYIHVLPAGSIERLTCTINTADTIQWEDANNDVVVAGPVLDLIINDSIHEKVYYCRGYRMQGIINELQVVAIALVPESSLSVTASSDDGTPTLGQQYGVDCLAVLNVTGIQNRPGSEWVDSVSGLALSPGNGVTFSGPTNVASMGSQTVLRIASLRTSHAGNYSCRGTVSSRALFSPLVKISTFSIAVTIPSPMVSLSPIQSGPFYVGGSVTFQCQASISMLVDTPVSLLFTWRKNNAVTLNNSSRIMITTNSQAYRSSLTITGLSHSLDTDGAYVCEVTIQPRTPMPLIMASTPAVSSPYTLNLIAAPISVSVTPPTTTVLDIQPNNRFSLTCIASTDFATAQKIFSWTKRVSGSLSSTPLTHNGGSVIITTTGQTSLISNSTLSTLETRAGTYVYTCSVSIGSSTAVTSDSTVTVRGQSLPTPVTNLTAIVTDYTSATIEWTVPYFAYTQESYSVLYGINAASLVQSSSAITGSTDLSTTNQRYSVQLTQLQAGSMYYYQIQSTNIVGTTVTRTSSFMIRQISIITAITDSTSGATPRAGSTFTLMCMATEQEDITGTPTVSWMDPSGRSLSEGTTGDFTVTRQIVGRTVTLSLQFIPVRASHSGQYSCRVELGTVSFIATERYNLAVVVASTIPVNISTINKNFKAATPLQLRCQVDSSGGILPVVGSLSYSWTSTCIGECFVLGQTASTVTNQALRSVDSGIHTCTITDSVGNYGSANFSFTVTGVGLYHSQLGLLANNSVIHASGGVLGSVSCISGRSAPGVGQWISPDGQDYTQPGAETNPFRVLVGGATNPGILNVTLGPPGRFPSGQWEGVYSCIIPDENQTPQVLYMGIHIGTTPSPVIPSLRPSSTGLYTQFTLNCTSTSSAATNVTWRKEGVQLNRGLVYDFSQILREGVSSTYDNVLIVYQTNVNELAGNYTCTVENAFGRTTQTVSLSGIRVSEFGTYSLSDRVSITCSSDLGVNSVQWLYNNEVIATSGNSESQVELRIDQVSDSIHNRQYTCQTLSPFGIQEHTVNILVEIDAIQDLSVTVIPSSPIPTAGQPFTLTCTVSKAAGLQNTPSVEWLDANGIVLVSSPSTGVNVGDIVVVSGNIVNRAIRFDNLEMSYSEAFTCRGSISSTAPPYLLTKISYWEIVVGEEFRPTTSTPPIVPPTINPGALCTQMLQLLLGPIDDCDDWRFDDTEEKIIDIIDSLVEQVNKDCATCSLTAQEITDTRFACPENNPKAVLFQATIMGDNTFNCNSSFLALKQWASDAPSITVNSNALKVDSNCDIEVNDGKNPPKCGNASPASASRMTTIIAIVVFAALAVIVIIFAATIGIICGIKIHRRGKHPVTHARGRRGSDVDPLTPPSPVPSGANLFTREVDEKNRGFNKSLDSYINPLEEYEQESERSVKIAVNPQYRSVDNVF